MFNFDEIDREDLSHGPTQASSEGQESLLDHRWVWMGIVVFGIGAVLHNAALLAIPGFMIASVVFGWLWSRVSLGSVSYQRRFHHRRAFPGEDVEAQIIVENRKLLPLTWLQIEDEWPTGFRPADADTLVASEGTGMGYLVNVYALRWYERVRRRYLLTAQSRGIYQIGPTYLISGDPFSLFERDARHDRRDLLIVYPVIKPLEELGMIAKDPFGDLGTSQRLFEDPSRMIGVRDYRSGDGFRSVHWKATARLGTLQVKQFEPTRSMSLVFCLNIASFDQHWRGVWPELIEHLLVVTASLVAWGLDAGYAVGIAANATLSHADRSLRAQPSRNRAQLAHLLELLAGISYFITDDYPRFLLAESARLPWGATLVLVTGLLSDELSAAIWQLRRSGRRIVLISVGKTPPPETAGILTYHLPVEAEEPSEEVAAVLDLRQNGSSSKPSAPHKPAAPTTSNGTTETPRQRYLRERAERDRARAEVVIP